MANIEEIKAKILSILAQEGPRLPVQISKHINMSPIFSSAILSELLNEQKIKMSNLRVGNSPVYFIPGDEEKLENFSDNLKDVEKIAFLKLKQEKVLEDEKQEPAIRVALRSIKDFARQLKINDKLIWKYFTLTNEGVVEILNKKFPAKEEIAEKKSEINIEIEKTFDVKNESINKIENENVSETIKESSEAEEDLKPKAKLKTKQKKDNQAKFLDDIKEFLIKKKIEFVGEVKNDKKEIIAKALIDSDLGKISFLIIAKDKKKISEAELSMAYHQALEERMPCLFISRAELTKKISQFLESYGNLLKFERI